MKHYDFKKIEKKWQAAWERERVYEPGFKKAFSKKHPRFYNLMMFPYPSAEGLHVGNMYAFTGSDIYGRFKRMQGFDVFEPMGLDGFGIHSENYALKIGAHPMRQAKISEKRFYKQLRMIGNGFAWDERVETYDPAYYRWTQWIFVQMWKRGLAYRKKQSVNWCPSCKTVLADEQVIQKKAANHESRIESASVCERCATPVVKKDLEQWFFRITKYAERLLRGLESLDWSEKVKAAQRNWIGRSEGSVITFALTWTNADKDVHRRGKSRRESASRRRPSAVVEVFTTRPDTLFGATYLVLAPEHDIISKIKNRILNIKEIKRYVETAKKRKESERVEEGKDKTGVELKGVKAVNPANNEEIPIWVADYVLGSYGTGAIMAVPAHDQRDWDFAKQFNLPITRVIRAKSAYADFDQRENVEFAKELFRLSEKERFLLVLTGGMAKSASRDGKFGFHSDVDVFADREGLNRIEDHLRGRGFTPEPKSTTNTWANFKSFRRGSLLLDLFLLEEKDGILFDTVIGKKFTWGDRKSLAKVIVEDCAFIVPSEGLIEGIYQNLARKYNDPYLGEGVVTNSRKFNGMDSTAARWEITGFVGGKRAIQYRLRDWLISRQRYWGPPIPVVYCNTCWRIAHRASQTTSLREGIDYTVFDGETYMIRAVPEKDLPVKLPFVKDFRPRGKGKSPLATVKSFYEATCPECGGKARRETDVSDTFLDSAWYYLGYLMASQNWKLEIGDRKFKDLATQWLPIDMYIGGAEHSVLHLLYVRFLAMAFRDMGLVGFEEPATRFRAHGLLIKEGAKMSKSKGNVINPDEYVKKFGADALRMYLMFLAPFEQGGNFRDSGILGITRFLDRAWKLSQTINASRRPRESADDILKLLNTTIIKVTKDIGRLQYNTAISAMMILLNAYEANSGGVSLRSWIDFLKLLAPFAPHITEELWQEHGRGRVSSDPRVSARSLRQSAFRSIHLAGWPAYNEKLAREESFTMVIQVNGKVRGSVEAPLSLTEKEASALALAAPRIREFLGDKPPKRTIYVPGRLINIVT